MTDYAFSIRQQFLSSGSLDAKRAEAIRYLGERYVLHPKHSPKRRTPVPSFVITSQPATGAQQQSA